MLRSVPRYYSFHKSMGNVPETCLGKRSPFFSCFLSFFLSFFLILHSLFIWPFSFSSVLLFSMYFLLGWPLGFSFSWFLFCWLPAQVKAAEMEGNSVATLTGRWGNRPRSEIGANIGSNICHSPPMPMVNAAKIQLAFSP